MKIKLIAFDFDGVIHDDREGNCIIRFHKALGTANEKTRKYVLELYQKFLKGKISYEEWGQREINLWKGKSLEILKKEVKNFKWIPHAKETIKELKERGYKIALISTGGPKRIIEPILRNWGFDYIYMNDVGVYKGKITGRWIVNVCFNGKRKVLKEIAEKEGISTKECAVVGDSLNDRSMFREAGFSIAFCAKDEGVKRAASVIVNKKDLREIIKYFPRLEPTPNEFD